MRKEDNLEIWKNVVDDFYNRGQLDKETYEHLNTFFYDIEKDYLFKNIAEERKETEIIESLENIFKELDEVYLNKEIFPCEDEHLQQLKMQLAVNEEKYIKQEYRKTKSHYILYEFFKTLGKRLEKDAYNRGQYKKYGKNNYFDFGYHCLSPFFDLIISNASRGTLYKRIPKDMIGKAEYIYDESGKLILYKKNREKKGDIYYLQFLIYGIEETVSLLYMVIDDKYLLEEVGFQYYKDEHIIKNDKVVWNFGGEVKNIGSVISESYIYENGVLTNAWREGLIFSNFLLNRNYYSFGYDEYGYIDKFLCKEFWGDGERIFPWGEQYTPIQERKKKDTGKESARWKKPNYFNI